MNLQNQIVYIYLSTGTRKTLQTVKQGVDKTMKQNPMLTTISKQMGKQPNNTKDEFLGVLFAAFVKSNRSPNGRSKRVQYWIHSQYKHLTYHPEKDNERKEDSFFESFCEFLVNFQDKGGKISTCHLNLT